MRHGFLWVLAVLACLAPVVALADGNHVRNGGFDAWTGDCADNWVIEGDSGVVQAAKPGLGVAGDRSLRLECTSFSRQSRDSYATIAQYDYPGIEAGKWYRFSCWARQEGMASGMATVELWADTKAVAPYTTGQLFMQLPVRSEWRRFERLFNATQNGSPSSKLAFYFDFTGTLELDNVEIVETGNPQQRYTDTVPRASLGNLLPNGGFECGTYNWSSLGTSLGFAGGLTGLYGEVQRGGAFDGSHCLRIELGPGKTPVSTFNVMVKATKQHAPLAANLGWIETTVGSPYVLSAYMRADRDNVPAKLRVRFSDPQLGASDKEQPVVLDTEWKRYVLTCEADRPFAYVAAGPDLSTQPDSDATVWIDAVQFEAGNTPSNATAFDPVELGFTMPRYGNIVEGDEPFVVIANVSNMSDVPTNVPVRVEVRDYFDKVVKAAEYSVAVPANAASQTEIDLGLPEPGSYAVMAEWEANGVARRQELRTARITPYAHGDSAFGMNHAPSTNQMCEHLRKAGLVTAREWTMEWQEIEPKPGEFKFAAADTHVNRVLGTGMRNIQQLPPFPSVSWNTTAPEGVPEVPGVWWKQCFYPPRDVELFKRYASTVVNHFKDRIHVWEYLNEPLYTIHSLPNVNQMDANIPSLPNANFTVKDYIALLAAFRSAVKSADPTAMTIGGLGGRPDLLSREFFEAGGLEQLDAFNLHIYPGLRRPEGYVPQMKELLRNMDAAPGGRKPIWMTECSYYGVDKLPFEPYIVGPGPWAANRQLRNERECADYVIRYNAIMLAHGVEKICFHWGGAACADVNDGMSLLESWMTGSVGTPRKLYAAQSAMANLLGPSPVFEAELARPDGATGVYGYAFQCGPTALAILWAPRDENPESSWTCDAPDGVKVRNIVGALCSETSLLLNDSPIYIVSDALSAKDLAEACKLRQLR